jgi:organic hydroperoxide reductase OsmC/OhrA
MTEHRATVRWQHTTGDFIKGTYSREHTWAFDGGAVVPASPSPAIVPLPHSNPAGVDPEEALVASISSCHMLTFLGICHHKKIEVLSYEDDAVGTMTKNAEGYLWVSSVVLRPRIVYGDGTPSPELEETLHHAAHVRCFIANSVKTDIKVISHEG